MNTFPTALMGLFAQVASDGERVRELVAYDLRRLARFDDPRTLWLVLAVAMALLVGWVAWWYHRERDALSRPRRWLLAGLRLVALAALALFFLGPEKRIDQEIVTDSQVVILVDTSQSMSVEDESSLSPDKPNQKVTRAAAIAAALSDTPLVAILRQQHDVVLAAFDEEVNRVTRWKREPTTQPEKSVESDTNAEPPTAWVEKIQPRGGETRLGGALRAMLEPSGGGPLAGVIVLSDGGQNSGVEPLEMADLAAERQSPIYTIGVGSTEARRNLRVQELSAPSRVYPDDKATVSCLIQNEGFAGRTVDVELFAREADVAGATGNRVGREQVTFSADGEVVPVKFDFEPVEVGRLAMEVRIAAPPDDQYAADNRREVEVEVVETESRVLLIASGAVRDYRFLRNQLRRDAHMQVDVWLQSSPPGISQDADELLHAFPETKQQLYEYDCIVAFDPDWTLLDPAQVDILETWVAE